MDVKLWTIMLLVFVLYANTEQKRRSCNSVAFRGFYCDDGEECVWDDYFCDTEANDCDDNSDEANCPTDCSHGNQFKCENGQKCIARYRVCNDEIDCDDGSDESICRVGVPFGYHKPAKAQLFVSDVPIYWSDD
ncbi:low-density lipoprotein receptor-like [Physella acuta]|uniref:low-density lipoprotein receptor-like n=1 Tax=Physella acuta TaxID=109671 RepID=UPI0027DD6D26|nr:low-density lipoprotein receptor-like [Physella acuta]